METIYTALIISQLAFTIIAGIYFFQNMKSQQTVKTSINTDSKKETDKLHKLRQIHLTAPLSEKTRPCKLSEIVGQDKGIRALQAAICGPNPQHVIIYGPPGIGKTAAARILLEEAKQNELSPFGKDSHFIEVDASTLQFDERSIADPLIGSVHDPIYQGAGAYGPAGVPQPKAGAVTRAHGGILFLDEIGELHPIQMNKLLKVLEDRVVYLNSAYYSPENQSIPGHIHEIFKNGFPADFRLIGATTRQPEELPPALRSRCTEIFFRSLHNHEVKIISENAAKKAGFAFEDQVPDIVASYAVNGRDTVNIVQTAASIALIEQRRLLKIEDIEWTLEFGRYNPVMQKKAEGRQRIGHVNGLAVCGAARGALLEIEADVSVSLYKNKGLLTVTGIVEEEELNSGHGKMRRNSTVRASVANALTVLKKIYGVSSHDYDIHINFPGGMPVDGPSAGIAIFCAVYSAVFKKEVSGEIAMTGEISIKGNVHSVGGVHDKIEAALEAGVKKVIIPRSNFQKAFRQYDLEVTVVDTIGQVIDEVFGTPEQETVQIGKSEVFAPNGISY